MRRLALAFALALSACTTETTTLEPANDAGARDFGFPDPADLGVPDGTTPDVGLDAGVPDLGAPESCGDGSIDPQESCDDQNTIAGDGCSATCAIENGWVCFGEPSVCSTVCGDGIHASVEGCDDANLAGGDGCSAACRIEPGWECIGLTPDVCSPLCGDGLIVGIEACDDANNTNADGCNGSCMVELGWACSGAPSVCVAVCGDLLVVGVEECDDGNTINADACEADCTLPFCGNGITDTVGAEECDDGNAIDGDTCESDCTLPVCGNGILDIGEACDDGNTVGGDGCAPDCMPLAVCGDGAIELGEECDDGNLVSGDGCSAACAIEGCGNNLLELGEDCDDGNLVGGDGCSPECLIDVIASTNVVSAGYGGIRDIGTGTIELQGVTGTVSRALLYWYGPTRFADPAANAAVTFAGAPIVGTNIGISGDNCWGYLNSQAYRADVTSLVGGNGSYTLADFVKLDVNTHGVSLVVFFEDGNATNNTTVYLFDSNDSNIDNPSDGAGWMQTFGGMLYFGTGTVTVELHVGDGQTFPDEAFDINGLPFIPAGSTWEGNTVPNGPTAAGSSGGLWDFRRYEVTQFFLAGTNTLTLTSGGAASDCLSLVASIFLVPAP